MLTSSERYVAPARTTLSVQEGGRPGPAWDLLVSSCASGTFSHLSGWWEIMSDVLGHRCRYMTAVDGDGEEQGVLPLVHLRSRLTGSYLVSMPFLSDGGPLGRPEAQSLLVERAVDLARGAGAELLELRSREALPTDLPAARPKLSVHLSLPATAEQLWNVTFRAKLRSQIRRAEKEGMQVRFGPDQLGSFYEVFAHNMRDLGTPVHGRRFFERIAATFPRETVAGTVLHQGTPVAAGLGFLWRGEFELAWASSLREFNRLSPNMLLYWAFMREMLHRGARSFNFGRCTPGGSTHRFKLQWGGSEVPLHWVSWTGDADTPAPSPDRSALRLATTVWQRVPLPIANRLGPLLARRVPWF